MACTFGLSTDVNLTYAQVTWEEGISTEKMPPSKSVLVIFFSQQHRIKVGQFLESLLKQF